MKIRVASLCFVAAFVSSVLPAEAQAQASIAARVAALEARVAKLESGQVNAADLVGTYGAYILALDLTGNTTAQVRTETGGPVTFTLNADGTASFSGTSDDCTLREGTPWSLTCNQESGSGTGTWTIQQDGSLGLFDQNGNDVINDPNFIGAGGRVIISGGTAAHANEGFSLLMIAIRLPNP